MPSETLHSSHLAHKPGETVTESGIILPSSVGRESNVRNENTIAEMKKAMEIDATSTETRSESPYDRFVLGSEGATETHAKVLEQVTSEIDNQNSELSNLRAANEALKEELDALRQQVAELKGEKPLAADQPRRVRSQDGVTEKLVKFNDGTYAWETISVDPNFVSATASKEKEETPKRVAGTDLITVDTATESPVGEVEPGQEPTPAQGEVDEQDKSADEEQPADEKQPAAIEPTPAVDDEERKKQDEKTFEVQISEELQAALSSAQDKYAEATAKGRNGFVGHLLYGSKYLAAIPGLQKLADRMNDSADAKTLDPARAEYKTALVNIQEEIRAQYIAELGANEEVFEKIRMGAMDEAIKSETDLEIKIAASRMEQSGKTNKFINWWVRQDGLGGKLRKAAVVAGAGLTAGVVLGLAGAPLIVGAIAGGGVGAGVGGYVTKKRANGLTEKDGTQTLAQEQQYDDLISKNQYVEQQKGTENGFADVNSLVGFTDDRTADERIRNRARVRNAAIAGGVAGSFGAGIGAASRAAIEGLNDAGQNVTPPEETSESDAGADVVPPETPPEQPELQGLSFEVESGNGYTQELVDFAQANGHNLSPDQSLQLHQDLVGQFGENYINIGAAGNDVYTQAGELRLMEPGSATWADGVGQYVQQWMAARGLW